MQILKLISQGMRPPRRGEPPLNDKAWELIQRCWAQEASERPGMRNAAEWIMAILTQSSTGSAPTSSPYHSPAIQIPNVYHMTSCPTSPFPLPVISRRPSQTWLQTWMEDLSADIITTESLLVPPQPLNHPGQSNGLSVSSGALLQHGD